MALPVSRNPQVQQQRLGHRLLLRLRCRSKPSQQPLRRLPALRRVLHSMPAEHVVQHRRMQSLQTPAAQKHRQAAARGREGWQQLA